MTWNKTTSERKALIKRRLIKRQRGKCPLCGRSLVWWKGTLDHIIPKSKGGPDAEWNYQVVHDQCNAARGNAELPESLRKEAELHLGIKNGTVRVL